MSRRFKDNQKIVTTDGKTLSIIKFLGSGGQGEVYEVLYEGRRLALKWYFLHTGTQAQADMILKLVRSGKPDDRFLWPIGLVKIPDKKSFGYVMPLRPYQFSNIVDLMKRRVEPNFDAVITACVQLADSFNKLHKKQLCYSDISFGNVFFHPRSGDVLICDNDNVTDVKFGSTNVLGTPRFMAPEVVLGKSKPNIESDQFSLSILLFYMLMMHHPLEGKLEAQIKCFDLPAMTKLYGEKPVFIYDPMNPSNRPLKGYHDNAIAFWPIYTERIRQMFTQSFTMGARVPKQRISERVWRDVLVELKNAITICECGMENFYDIQKLRSNQLNQCWHCNRTLKPAARIKINNEVVVLNLNTKLYGHHLITNEKYKFKKILAEVVPHPKLADRMGLKNLSHEPWTIHPKQGQPIQVDFGRSFTIEDGVTIDFGEVKGMIRRG